MIDIYLIDKFILKNNENYENENENQNKNNNNQYLRNIINVIHLIALIISIYLYYDCNKKINAEIILSIFFPYSYIIYNFAIALNNKQEFSIKNRCPNNNEISDKIVNEFIDNQVKNANTLTNTITSENQNQNQNGGKNDSDFSLNSDIYASNNNSPISDFSITFY